MYHGPRRQERHAFKCFPKSRGVYYILNNVNGRMYVGQSQNVRKRLLDHAYRLVDDRHPINALQNDWNTFGASAFEVGVLAVFPKPCGVYPSSKLIESIFIRAYRANEPAYGYNTEPS